MIMMDVKVDNLYSFKNFHMNLSYPKKIVDSSIDGEYLTDRPNFRYKKVNILMGANAAGKTSLGKTLMLFANYCKDKSYERFLKVIGDTQKPASLAVDFVTRENTLYRFQIYISPKISKEYSDLNVSVSVLSTPIGRRDNYETCADRLDRQDGDPVDISEVDTMGWYFTYPEDAWTNKTYYSIEDDPKYLRILEKMLKTLDPSITSVIKMKEVDNTYAIKLENHSVIIKDGKILESEILSSGTKAGLDISYIIASLFCDQHDLYYCDELFSYVNSDIEKACLSIIISKLDGRKQLFFTTHNTDILDMQLPKHSFTFLKKDVRDKNKPIQCVNASEFLKRSTDCLKNAVENDLFSSAPELDELYEIENL